MFLVLGNHFETPTPTHEAKTMNRNMAALLSSLPCFEAFWVIFCPYFCSYFCLVCGGRGSLARLWGLCHVAYAFKTGSISHTMPLEIISWSIPGNTSCKNMHNIWMRLFCLEFEASFLQLSFFAYSYVVEAFFAYNFSCFTYNFSSFSYNWSFFAYSGKVQLIGTSLDCKQKETQL